MKTRLLLLPIMLIALAPVLLGGCYTMISQSVYERPDVQRPERVVVIERPAPAREENVSQKDTVKVETDQQGLEVQKDVASQDDGDQYDKKPTMNNNYYGSPDPYIYDNWRYPPGWYGSYIWDPYIFTPHLYMGFMYNPWDPFYWRDPWAFGYNSWYYDPWYSSYYAMYDPWYYRGYDYGYYGNYGNYGGGGGGGGDGRHDGVAQGPRKIRPDRLAGFGTFANSGGVYIPDNSASGKATVGTGGAGPVTRGSARDGFGTTNTRRGAQTAVTEKATAGTVAAPGKRTSVQENPLVRQRTRPGEMTWRVKDSESYVITIPNDGSGRPIIQYRDRPAQPDYPKEIRISRQDDPKASAPAAVSENRPRIQNVTVQRRAGDVNVTQSQKDLPDTAPNTEKAVNRSVPSQNNTPTERVETSRSNTPPSRDTGRTAPSYTPPTRGGSAPSYTPPRSSGGSSSGGQSRPPSSSRSGQRRR